MPCLLCSLFLPRTAVSLHFLRRSGPDTAEEVLLLRRQIGGSSNSSAYSVDGVRVTADEYRRVLSEKLSLSPHTTAASLLLQVRDADCRCSCWRLYCLHSGCCGAPLFDGCLFEKCTCTRCCLVLLHQGDSSVTNAARFPLELARLIERVGSRSALGTILLVSTAS